jgi:hypothetical protein
VRRQEERFGKKTQGKNNLARLSFNKLQKIIDISPEKYPEIS